jgi:hypothetical protein
LSDYFCTLVEAPMGGGKTNTVTGLITDDLFAAITSIQEPDYVDDHGLIYPGKIYPCVAHSMNMDGMIVRLQCEDERLVLIPDDFIINSPVKIFANYHLYGIPYVFADFSTVLNLMNSDTMHGCKWVIDEGWLGADARKGMSPLTILITQYAQLMRKMEIDLYWITQHARFLDWRIRYIAKRKILTKYNSNTRQCRLMIQDLIKGTEKVIHYDAPIYWRYYNTNEVPPMPHNMVQKARAYT